MASYAASERALVAAVKDLHDLLRAGTRTNETRLLRRLDTGTRALDRHVGTRGEIPRAVRPLLRHFEPVTTGADLFTFLRAVTELSAAVDRVGRSPKEAARHASDLAVSLTIRLASAADRRLLADEFESGRTDFAEFSATLTDAMEGRGVLRAREFGRAVNMAFDVNALWATASGRDAQRISATTAVSCVAFACVLFVEALRALGRYREAPFGPLTHIVGRILRGLE